MADKTETPAPAKAPETVEVRLLARTFQHETPRGIVLRKQGETFRVDKRIYDTSVEPDRGMGRPAHSRVFVLVDDEKKASEKKTAEAQTVQDRIAAMRSSVADQERATELARANARVMEAEHAKKLAEALKPLERPGARREG